MFSGFPESVLKLTPVGNTGISRRSEDGQAQEASVLSHLLVLAKLLPFVGSLSSPLTTHVEGSHQLNHVLLPLGSLSLETFDRLKFCG